MTIPPKLQPIIYGIGVFVVFTTLMIILKLLTHHVIENGDYFGLFNNKDLMMGAAVALLVTFSHERKRRLK